jgi:hypothetical protein
VTYRGAGRRRPLGPAQGGSPPQDPSREDDACTAPRVRGDTRPADRRVTLRGAFRDGTPAAANGLEIMPAFDAAGALTKSSTLDGAPREPLVYGACRPVAAGRDKARYLFFTAAPAADWGAAAGANALQAKR